MNGRAYQSRSLPVRLAGKSVQYDHQEDGILGDKPARSLERDADHPLLRGSALEIQDVTEQMRAVDIMRAGVKPSAHSDTAPDCTAKPPSRRLLRYRDIAAGT